MPILKIPSSLYYYTDGVGEVKVQGRTVSEAMLDLVRIYPILETHLYNKKGMLRPFVNLFVGDMNINTLRGLDTPVEDDDHMLLIPSIAGGGFD